MTSHTARRLFYGALIVLLCLAVRVSVDLIYNAPGGVLTGD